MSLKIYNAYYTENETIESIQNKIYTFYLNNKANIEKHFYNKLLKEVIENFDCGSNTEVNPFEIFYKNFKDDFTKSQLQNIRVNIDFSTTICFKKYNGKTYWKIFSEERSIIEMIENHFELKDYHYQNSTDKPFDISEEDWNNRKTTWENLLTNYSFKESGFISVQLISFQPVDFFNLNLINKYLSKNKQLFNKDYRANEWFKNTYFDFIENLILQLKPELETSLDRYQIIRKFFIKFNSQFSSFNKNNADKTTKHFFNTLNQILKPIFLKYAPEIDIRANIWDKRDCYNEIQQKLNNNDFIKKYVLKVIN